MFCMWQSSIFLCTKYIFSSPLFFPMFPFHSLWQRRTGLACPQEKAVVKSYEISIQPASNSKSLWRFYNSFIQILQVLGNLHVLLTHAKLFKQFTKTAQLPGHYMLKWFLYNLSLVSCLWTVAKEPASISPCPAFPKNKAIKYWSSITKWWLVCRNPSEQSKQYRASIHMGFSVSLLVTTFIRNGYNLIVISSNNRKMSQPNLVANLSKKDKSKWYWKPFSSFNITLIVIDWIFVSFCIVFDERFPVEDIEEGNRGSIRPLRETRGRSPESIFPESNGVFLTMQEYWQVNSQTQSEVYILISIESWLNWAWKIQKRAL